jgi:hypothetical protein
MSRVTVLGYVLAVTLGASFPVTAQDTASIQKKLVEDYPLTQPTAAFDDIVTAGAVVVLEKGPLMMVAVSSSVNPYASTYKNGKLQSSGAKAKAFGDKLSHIPGFGSIPGASQAANAPSTRTFVTGEKMWVTKIDTRADAVVVDLFTDAYSDVRYKTTVTFPYPTKGTIPSVDDVEKLVGEVFKVQPAEDAKDAKDNGQQGGAAEAQGGPAKGGPGQGGAANGAAAPAATQQQAAEAPPPPIAPPPPPPADPKTVSVGQTPDQVVEALGQPEKKVKLNTKTIFYYKDMKVIFVNGKVTDVQ